MKKFHGGEVLRKRKHQMPDYSYLCIQHYLLFRNRAFPLILMLLRKYLKICHILVINKKTHGLVFFRFSIHAISLTISSTIMPCLCRHIPLRHVKLHEMKNEKKLGMYVFSYSYLLQKYDII